MKYFKETIQFFSHAAVWVIIAQALIGFGDKALDLYRMINPIEHSRIREASNKYKTEKFGSLIVDN